LKRDTGWSAKVGIKEGLKNTIEWYEKNPSRLRICSSCGGKMEVVTVEGETAHTKAAIYRCVKCGRNEKE
jgi:DNA-directed RNA polymerase subunit RPC12/RpoP